MGCKLQEEVARTGSASSSDVPAAQRQRSEQLRPRSRFNRPQVPSRRLNDIDVDAMRGTLGSVQVFNDVGRTAMTAVQEIRAGGSVRCDYVILRRGTDDVAGAIELKSMKTMGLILDEDLDTLMTNRRQAAINSLKGYTGFNGRNADSRVYGALDQLLLYLVKFGVSFGLLTDGSLFVFLCLRRRISQSGEGGLADDGTGEADAGAMGDAQWHLFYHVVEESLNAPVQVHYASAMQCFAFALKSTLEEPAAWVTNSQAITVVDRDHASATGGASSSSHVLRETSATPQLEGGAPDAQYSNRCLSPALSIYDAAYLRICQQICNEYLQKA